jgi:hypothetical protein
MSKKLLSEAQVRRFQALATIKPLVEMESYNETEEEEGGEELEMDAAPDMEMDAEEPEGEDMGDADVELDEELVEKFMDAVSTIQQVADSLGGAAGGEMDLGAEEPMDMGGEDLALDDAPEEGGEEMDLGAEDEEEEEEAIMEALKGISYVPSQKEVVKVVAKRVARRLQEAKIAQRRLNRALGKK